MLLTEWKVLNKNRIVVTDDIVCLRIKLSEIDGGCQIGSRWSHGVRRIAIFTCVDYFHL